MTRRYLFQLIGFATAIWLLSQAPALANEGVPMALVIMPYAALVLLPVIVLETFTAKFWLRLSWGRSFRLSAYCNLVSTLLGIPLTWGGLYGLQIASGASQARGLASFSDYIYAVTFQSPWLGPYDRELDWMIPVAAVWLTLAFGLMSVPVEALAGWFIARRWSERERAKGSLFKLLLWSAPSNFLSYGPILIALMLYTRKMLLLRF